MKNSNFISRIAIGSAVLSLVSIFILHFLSPELDPMWHMVSEYAYGQYGVVLFVFFISWATSYFATGLALAPLSKNWAYRVGVFLILLSGTGAVMGGQYFLNSSLRSSVFFRRV